MRSYEYGGSLFGYRRYAILAMVEDWLTAQGLNDWDSAEVQSALSDPAKAAAEMTSAGWNTLAVVGSYDDDDGGQSYETISTADIQGAMEEVAQVHLLTNTIEQDRGGEQGSPRASGPFADQSYIDECLYDAGGGL